jgi:hypothetical protein
VAMMVRVKTNSSRKSRSLETDANALVGFSPGGLSSESGGSNI